MFKNNSIKYLIAICFLTPLVLISDDSNLSKKYKTEITKFLGYSKDIKMFSKLYDNEQINLVISLVENKSSASGIVPNKLEILIINNLESINSSKINFEDMDYLDPSKVLGKLYFVKGVLNKYELKRRTSTCIGYSLKYIKPYSNILGIAISFKIYDYGLKKIVPNVDTNNSIKFVSLKNSDNLGFSITGSGFDIQGRTVKAHDGDSIIKLLVELSVVELIGKLNKYPYRVKIHNYYADSNSLKKIENDFNKFDKDTKRVYFQYLLSLLYDDINVNSTNIATLNKKIIKFKKNNSIAPCNEEMTLKMYMVLLKKVNL